MDLYRAPLGYPFPAIYPDAYKDILPDDRSGSAHEEKSTRVIIWRRNFVGLLAFFGFFCAYMIRTNLSIAIVSMTNVNKTANVSSIPLSSLSRTFAWSEGEKSWLLSSFYCGYMFTQVVGGWLSIKIGGAKVFGFGIFISALIAIVIPFLSKFDISYHLFMAARMCQGFFQGATYPSMHAVWSRWAPPDERTRLASMGFSGAFMGTMTAFPLCGFLSENFGWPFCFFVPGLASCLWYAIWLCLIRDDPEKDPWISDEELDYLRSTLGHPEFKDLKHPWLSFLTSMPVWAIIVSHFCENWGFYTMLLELPIYFSDTLKFNLLWAGFLSSLPFLLLSVSLPIAGLIIDKVRKWNVLSITAIRKIFNCGAFLLQSGFMCLAAQCEDPKASTACITLSIGIGAFAWAAFGVNHLDIAPPHAGILMGLSNMVATFAGIFSPSFAGHVIEKDKTKNEWNVIFLVSSAMYLFGALFYAIFGSGQKQPWVREGPSSSTTTASVHSPSFQEEEEEDDEYQLSLYSYET